MLLKTLIYEGLRSVVAAAMSPNHFQSSTADITIGSFSSGQRSLLVILMYGLYYFLAINHKSFAIQISVMAFACFVGLTLFMNGKLMSALCVLLSGALALHVTLFAAIMNCDRARLTVAWETKFVTLSIAPSIQGAFTFVVMASPCLYLEVHSSGWLSAHAGFHTLAVGASKVTWDQTQVEAANTNTSHLRRQIGPIQAPITLVLNNHGGHKVQQNLLQLEEVAVQRKGGRRKGRKR
eukprot:SAG31_NODE_204_length_20414_cov_19.143392_2_plen_237_part_00